MGKLRVMLAEDHVLVRSGLRALLESSGQYEVVAEATDGHEAVSVAERAGPDVLVLDLGLPGQSGIEVIKQLKSRAPAIHILVLSMLDRRQHVIAALRAGARGYILKDAVVAELLEAVREVGAGRRHLSPSLANLVMDGLFEAVSPGDGDAGLSLLTDREKEILRWLVGDETNEVIARALRISPHTLHTHRRNIMEKLKVHSQAELVKLAYRTGFCTPR